MRGIIPSFIMFKGKSPNYSKALRAWYKALKANGSAVETLKISMGQWQSDMGWSYRSPPQQETQDRNTLRNEFNCFVVRLLGVNESMGTKED